MTDVKSVLVPLPLLVDFVNLIDMVSQRGAIKGEEMEGVGRLRGFCVTVVNENSVEEFPAEVETAEEVVDTK